jgi:hypothetical protein
LTAWRYGVWAALFAALMAIFTVIRHTRANEETGRQELIGSARVGRQASLSAALLVSGVASVTLAVLLAVILPFLGLPVRGLGRARARDRDQRAGVHRHHRVLRAAEFQRARRPRPGPRSARGGVPDPRSATRPAAEPRG